MELISTHMCKENDCGYHGNLFGGLMLAWLDEAAVAYACQICETPRMVTVSMDKVQFLKPVRPGQIIKIYGNLERASAALPGIVEERFGQLQQLEAILEYSTYNNSEKVVCRTKMKFVRIDGDGEAVPISNYIKEKHDCETTS